MEKHAVILPFAVLSSTFFSSRVNAASTFNSFTNPIDSWDIWGLKRIFKLYGDVFEGVYNFFDNFGTNTNHIITNTVLWVYNTISNLVLHTPEWLLDNDWFSNITHIFTMVSILIVSITVLSKILINIYKNKSLDEWDLCKKFLLALSVSCSAPYLLKQGVHLINLITDFIINIGSYFMLNNTQDFTLSNIVMVKGFGLDAVILLAFIGLYVILTVPIALKAGIRWFEIVGLGAATPLAMSAWIFDEFRGYHRMWWNNLKDRLLSQVIHASFLTFIGFLLFSTPTPTTFYGLLTKLLVVGGGLWKMIYPPRFVSSEMSGGENITDVYKNSKDNIKNRMERIKKNPIYGMARKMIFKK